MEILARRSRNTRHGLLRRALCAIAGAALLVGVLPLFGKAPAQAALPTYAQRFVELYDKIKDPANGYFSPEGVPYHSVETLIVEAPDHGHETTSETFSYWLWLEAMYGRMTRDWKPFNDAWATTEKYIIPSSADQSTNGFYNPSRPATYAPESEQPDRYPTPLDSGVSVGSDPLANELRSTYGTADVYGMHWLLDVDNWYGFGRCGDGTTRPAYINTFQRGPQESVWETVPHPSCETFRHGGRNGYLDLFVKDASYARQWRYTNAPDADARAVQVAYWAHTWAQQQGNQAAVSATVAKAAKMGDYLRYAMYDKYFKKPGCTSPSCAPGAGKDSAHWLMSWYYAWGGANDSNAGWAWRIGSSHTHAGYQNPVAAWALSNVGVLKPRSPSAATDWQQSLGRQLEFYRWLQSAEGAIAGGATNSWGGRYDTPPAGLPKFYGLTFDWQPVYHDPPSSQWFGFQAWSMERVAEYYYLTRDAKARPLLDKWVAWALSQTRLNADGSYAIPSTLRWSGQPDNWNPASPGSNANLHVSVVEHTEDVGVTGSLAKALMFYAAAAGHTASKDTAKALLDRMWANHQDPLGVAVDEVRTDYGRFDDRYNSSTRQGLYVPPGWTGTMPNGDAVNSSSTFLSIRSKYRSDPAWPKVDAYLKGGAAPVFKYHRFWAQADIATALGYYSELFESGSSPSPTPSVSPTVSPSASPTVSPTASPSPPGEASCRVSYVVRDQWSTGFTADVTVTNNGAPVNGWTLGFGFPGDQKLINGWSATWSQTAQAVTARSLSWNGNLATGASATVGFNGSHSGSNPKPTSFTLNGATCTAG